MSFTREINRLFLGLLAGLLLMSTAVTFYAVVGPQTLLNREDNARLFEKEASLLRGTIYDRSGMPLAASFTEDSGFAARRYYYAEMNSAVGYYSLRYGVGGLEALHNVLLRGDNLPQDLEAYFTQDVLHIPQTGSDIRVTLDLETQRHLARLLDGQRGAGVVLAVPSGEVLAIISLPTYDPNVLDITWDRLRLSAANPFFDRALQGKYQPGALLQTPLLAAAISNRVPLTTPYEGAAQFVESGGVLLGCARPPGGDVLTLQEAYLFGCPAPFAALAQQLGLEAVTGFFRRMQLETAYVLPGLTESQAALTSTPTASAPPAALPYTLDDILGQGVLTVSPMRMAIWMAGFAGDGRAPQPYTLSAARPPGGEAWEVVSSPGIYIPITTVQTARQVRDLLAENWREAGLRAEQSGGITALAYSGDQTNTWGIGYALNALGRGAVIALVIEDHDDLAAAQAIVIDVLETAMRTQR